MNGVRQMQGEMRLSQSVTHLLMCWPTSLPVDKNRRGLANSTATHGGDAAPRRRSLISLRGSIWQKRCRTASCRILLFPHVRFRLPVRRRGTRGTGETRKTGPAVVPVLLPRRRRGCVSLLGKGRPVYADPGRVRWQNGTMATANLVVCRPLGATRSMYGLLSRIRQFKVP